MKDFYKEQIYKQARVILTPEEKKERRRIAKLEEEKRQRKYNSMSAGFWGGGMLGNMIGSSLASSHLNKWNKGSAKVVDAINAKDVYANIKDKNVDYVKNLIKTMTKKKIPLAMDNMKGIVIKRALNRRFGGPAIGAALGTGLAYGINRKREENR